MSTNWTLIIDTLGYEAVQDFSDGRVSLETLYRDAVDLDIGPEIRPLVRVYGAARARQLARQALLRRRRSLV